MTPDIRREARLFHLIAAIVAGYIAMVAGTALAWGQADLLLSDKGVRAVVIIWASAFAIVFALYGADLLVRRRPARPLLVMAEDFRANVLRADWAYARAGVVLGFGALLLFFNTFKSMIANVRGFPFDHLLRDADRMLFLGTDPWRLTHAVIGPYGTAVLEFAYRIWFVLMWISLIYLILRPELARFRARYLTAFLLTWILVGSIAAWLFASAGPIFYERAFGDPYFAELTARLAQLDVRMRSLGLGGVDSFVSEALWSAYANRDDFFGGGISAMPSIHVGVSVTMALGAYQLDRRAGHLLALFALAIWIGSVHLAWHYALDGIVAAGMAWGIWRFSGALVDRFVFTDARGAAAVAA